MQVLLGGQQLTSDKLYLTAIRNAALSEVVYSTSKRGGFHGKKLSTPSFGSYKFVFEWYITGSSFADLFSQRRTLLGILGKIISDGSQTLQIITDDNLTLQVDVKAFDVTADITADDALLQPLSITFETEYPFLLNAAATSQDILIFNGGGFAVPFAIPFDMSADQSTVVTIINDGNFEAYPTIKFIGTLTTPTITNNTTGEALSLNLSLADSAHWVEIDTFNRTVIDQSGNNQRQYVSGTFPTVPIGTSTFTLGNANNSDGGKVSLTFSDTYLGV